jgi:hypothetical protein
MELNGVANIKLLVEMAIHENTECHTSISPELADKILEQCDTLERYMLAYAETTNSIQKAILARLDTNGSIRIPYWHEVRDNKDKYPTNRERHNVENKVQPETRKGEST